MSLFLSVVRSTLLIALIGLTSGATAQAQTSQSSSQFSQGEFSQNEFSQNEFFDEADAFFAAHVDPQYGDVAYARIAEDDHKLASLEKLISTYPMPDSLGDPLVDEAWKAFLINAYNLLVIRGVADHYPLESPLDVDGFFKGITYPVSGENYTLDQIENELLKALGPDPRLHFALVCGARGCPPLSAKAYRPGPLEGQLDFQAMRAVNHPEFVRFDAEARTVSLSQIFVWYRDDFPGKTDKDLIAYVNRYRPVEIPSTYPVSFYEYDWRLNGR